MPRPLTRLRQLPWGSVLQALGLLVVALLATPRIREHAATWTTYLGGVLDGREHGNDFLAFYAAGRLYDRERDASAYDLDRLRQAELAAYPALGAVPEWAAAGGVNPFRNPPFYLPLLGYLSRPPLPIAFVLSTMLAAAALGGLLVITTAIAAARAMPLAALTWLALSLSFLPVWAGLTYAQLPAFVVALALAAGLALLRADRPVAAGLVLAVLWLKLQYVPPLLLFLLATRQRSALAGFALGTLASFLTSLALIGPQGMARYAETLAALATASPRLYFVNYEWMFNWRATLERVLAGRAPDLILPAQAVLTLATYTLAAWVWHATRDAAGWRRDLQLVALSLALVLASPHTHGPDLMLLLPAGALIAGRYWAQTGPWPLASAVALGLLLLSWALPQQALAAHRFHVSVAVLALLFLACVVALRLPASVNRRSAAHPA